MLQLLVALLLLNSVLQEQILVASGQSPTGPRLSLQGEIIPNNGFVSAENIGQSDTLALLCITDSASCCSDRVSEQQWLFPNGTRVPLRGSGWTIWTSYDDGIIRLHHQTNSDDQVQGLFRCQIPNQFRVSLTLYVGIYPTNETEMQFHLETDVIEELHTFTLTCNSTGGPVVEVNWTRNGEPVNEEWNQYSIVTNLVEGVYHNWLFVPGSHEGLYRCIVFNNDPGSSVTALLSVNAPQRPVIEQLVHLSFSSLNVSWVQPFSIATAQILYYEANGVTNTVYINNSSTAVTTLTSYVLENLQSGLTYSISLQALSPQLPSPITDPIITTLGIVSPPSTPRITSMIPLSTSLDIRWESSGNTANIFRIKATYIGPCRDVLGDTVSTEVNGNTLQHNLTRLREYSTYSVVVIAMNNAGETSGREQRITTLSAAPTRRPTLTSVTSINASTISIEWEDTIPCQQRNGEITGFKFQAVSNGVGSRTTIHNTTSQEGQQHAFNLTWLSPDFEYGISVAAVNSMGQAGPYYPSDLLIRLPNYDGVGLMLHGRLLPNHSYVSLEELGQGLFDSLLCLTNKDIFSTRPREGEWYFPNGTRVPIAGMGWRFYRDRRTKIVRLHERYSSDIVFGMFRCEVKDNSDVPYILYAGIFPPHGGMVDLSLGIQVQLESDIQADIPQFTLYAESTGGPLTNVVWSLDGASINSSYSFSSSVLMDSQLAKYGLFLRVEGRLTGLYRVIVSNNRPSMATRAVNVYAPDPPANITIKQVEHNQVLLCWMPPPQPITGYRIYVEPRHELDVEYWFAERNSSQLTIHSLRERATYNISMLALSPFLPSLLTGPVEVTLRQVPYSLRIVSSPWTRTIISGQSYLLTCTVSLNEPTHTTEEGLEAITVQWLSITRNGTFSQIISNDQVSVSNLTAVWLDEYTFSLHFLRAETYHSGEYACQAEIDGIIRRDTVTITINRQLTTEEVLEYSVINSTSFIVKWSVLQFPFCISNCNSTTTQYRIRYGIVAANEVHVVQNTRREFVATGLMPLTNYSFEVTAVNSNDQVGTYTDPVYLFMPAERVGLIHHGEVVLNNSYILVDEINESLGALMCVTDKVDCCRGNGIDASSPQGGWHYPNRTSLSSMGTLYQERSTSVVRLLRSNGLVPFGLYRCTIPDKSNVDHSLYVGIYSSTEGNLSISRNIGFQLATMSSDQPVFVLRCISHGGPVRQVVWMRNGTTLSSELTNVMQHPSVIVDDVTAQYEHRLTVIGQILSNYRCNVTNNKPSLAYKDIGIFNAEPPVALQAEQYNLTSLMISWSPPLSGPEVTGYRIRYVSNNTDTTWLMVDPQTTSALISGLQSGDIYWVSAIAMSYFPSIETEPIEIFLYPMEVSIAEEGPHNVSTGQSFTLICVAILAPRTDIDWELNWLDSNNKIQENTNLTTRDTNTGAQEHIFVLIFNDLHLSDADEYTCQAIANYSSGSQVKMSSARLNVEIPSPVVNISIQDDDLMIQYSGTFSSTLICSAQLSPYVDIPVNITFWWFGPNGVISNLTEESRVRISQQEHELNSSVVITSAITNDSGEYTCLLNISPTHMSPFIIPSQIVSQAAFLTIVPICPPSGAPLNFTVSIDGPRMLAFSWRPPHKDLQNGPVIGYRLQCLSFHDHELGTNLTADDYLQLTNDRLSVSEFLPNITYNCSISAATSAGRGPIAFQTVSTPDDVALFQLHFLGVSQCSQWLVQCTASDFSHVQTVSDLLERSLSNSDHLNSTVADGGFMCGPNPEQMTFRAKLVAKGHRNTSAVLSYLEEWLLSNDVININGAILRLNKMCNLSISFLGVDLCDTDVIITTPQCDSHVPQPSAPSNIGAIIGGVGTVLVLTIIVPIAIVVLRHSKCLKRTGRYNVVKRKRSKDGRERSSVTDNENMTVLRGGTEMESCMQYYTNMSSHVDEEGDYAIVSSNSRYSIGLSLRENKMQPPAADPHPQEDFKPTEDGSNVADRDESQDVCKSDEEGIYEEPSNLVEYLQIVHVGNECKAVEDHNEMKTEI